MHLDKHVKYKVSSVLIYIYRFFCHCTGILRRDLTVAQITRNRARMCLLLRVFVAPYNLQCYYYYYYYYCYGRPTHKTCLRHIFSHVLTSLIKLFHRV